MIKPFLSVLCLTVLLCSSCNKVIKFNEENPETFLTRSDIINLPFTRTEHGLISVPVNIDDGAPISMVVDTAATQSAIYNHIYQRLELDQTSATVQIYGMVESGIRPEVILPSIRLDRHKISALSVAVLKKTEEKGFEAPDVDGLIGLDILDDFYIFFDHERQVLSLIPDSYTPPTLPPSWSRIALKPNPYKSDNQPLRYFDARVAGNIIPALFDTGSEFNLINWSAVKHPQVQAVRRSLKKKWEIGGAIGKFRPRSKINIGDIRSGQRFWPRQDFIVLNFDSLNVLGIEDQPFMIAGVDMIANRTFWLDLKAEEIVFKPDAADRRPNNINFIVKPF